MELNILEVVQQLLAVVLTALVPYLVILIKKKFDKESDTANIVKAGGVVD